MDLALHADFSAGHPSKHYTARHKFQTIRQGIGVRAGGGCARNDCARETLSANRLIGVSNPGYVVYTIYGTTCETSALPSRQTWLCHCPHATSIMVRSRCIHAWYCLRHAVDLYYIGAGKKRTGDWCFEDGYITFKDIASLYLQHFRGRILSVISDCSHSGGWIRECMTFLDEQGVRPCGPSAKEMIILIKIFASCHSHQSQDNSTTQCMHAGATKTQDSSRWAAVIMTFKTPLVKTLQK